MLIATPDDVTAAVLVEAARTPDARTREILLAGIAHLHAFVRDAQLTEPEFRRLCVAIARLGHATTASHNEVMLAAGSLGVSSLVCLLNNRAPDGQGTTANLMGPFWRQGAPHTEPGSLATKTLIQRLHPVQTRARPQLHPAGINHEQSGSDKEDLGDE